MALKLAMNQKSAVLSGFNVAIGSDLEKRPEDVFRIHFMKGH
jgi:hypothetical protein